MNRDPIALTQPMPAQTSLTKAAVYRKIEEKARTQQAPGTTLAQAVAAFLATAEGAAMYSQYLDALVDPPTVGGPPVLAVESPRDRVYARAHVAAMRQRTADESEAQAIANYFQTDAGRQSYAEYRSADTTPGVPVASAGSLGAALTATSRTLADLHLRLDRLGAPRRGV